MADRDIRVSSTTEEDQEAVQRAADAELEDAAGRQSALEREAAESRQEEQPEGEGPVTIASTSDSEEKVRAAAGLEPKRHDLSKRILKLVGKNQERLARLGLPPAAEDLDTRGTPQQQIDRLVARGHYLKSLEEQQRAAAPPIPQPQAPAREVPPEPPHLTAHRERLAEVKKFYPDVDAVLSGAKNINVREDVANAILSDPNSAHIQYLAAKFPELRDDVLQSPESVRRFSAALSQQHGELIVQATENHPEFKQRAAEVAQECGATEGEIRKALRMSLPTHVGQAILSTDNPKQIALYIVRHPEVHQRLVSLPPERAFLEIGRVAAQLERGNGHQPVSRAPAPIKPLGGNSTRSARGLDDPDISQAEFRRIRDEQERNRYRR